MTQNKTGVKKPIRTKSGVTPLTVVAKPYRCPHGRCIYCPGGGDTPNSYTTRSPAIMRALALNYDPSKQIEARLRAFKSMGHPTSKIEMIYLGGTFLSYPEDYQYDFTKKVFDGLNECDSKNLEEAKKINETAEHRCVALCIETKPDWAFEEHINKMLEFGCTRVELGVQIIDDKVYSIVNRGHTVADVEKSTRLLKDSGFKVGYHIMPGLPGSSVKNDLKKFKDLFSNPNFKPDQLKLYPLQLMENTPLYVMHQRGDFELYSESEMLDLICNMKASVPEYCRIMRIMRQFDHRDIKSGKIRSNSRTSLADRMEDMGLKCKCIRCREVGLDKDTRIQKPELKVLEYDASGGKEFFISFESETNLFGLIRLRIPGKPFRKEITNKSLIVREIHVYGKQVGVDSKKEVEAQHKGLGKKLMLKAEEIAKENCLDKVVVISGVGVRTYFRELGYSLEGPYMVKKI
jgi:elongator complex protein 3